MISPKKILTKYWGYTTFREPQEEIITSAIQNKDVIALLPTGGGKSICFQTPALAKDGICLVISPLIALMQDQVENLNSLDIKAALIPSKSSQDDIVTLFDNVKFGNYKFLYISPERLQSRFIQEKILQLNINLIAIDEAHCISEWGHDFRPSYRNIKILKKLKPNINFIALTATANNKVLADIATNLELDKPDIYKKSFYRSNLAYQIFNVEDKLTRLKQIFIKTKTPSIVYVNSRKKTVEIANFLNANNFKSSFYHGGLTNIEKRFAFDNWMSEKTPIIVATNAFGMGIDKPNVGLVIHFNLPSSIENYIQESGRAGRNNKKSFAVLLKNDNDMLLFKEQLQKSLPTLKEIKDIHKNLYQYFQIAKGEIFDKPFHFNLLEFCKKYKFLPLKVDLVLKILSNNGVLEIGSDYNKKSSLFINSNHKNLINYIQKNKKYNTIINTILRTYGGLFEQPTKINEFFIAKKANVTSHHVINCLNHLQKDNVLEYNQVKNDTEITFLVPREDDRTINSFSKEIKKFITQKEKKAIHFLNFVNNNKVCRSIQILDYFNENSTLNCGICDVCLSRKKMNTKQLSIHILKILKENNQLTSQEISNLLNTKTEVVLIHLRQLLAEELILINHQNKFQLK